MKKYFAMMIVVLMLLGIACSCKPKVTNEASSLNQGSDSSIVLNDEKRTSWDGALISAPTKVDSFDIPVLIGSDDTDMVNQKLYYNGDVYDSGYYSYIGKHNGRHYFVGYEKLDENYEYYGFICSCDENSENYGRFKGSYYDADRLFGPRPVMYNGLIYSWIDGELYSSDLMAREKKKLCSAKDHYMIDFISNGWVFSYGKNTAYNIKDGTMISVPMDAILGVDSKGIIYGYDKLPDEEAIELVTYNIASGKIDVVEKIENVSIIGRDDNGDVWAKITDGGSLFNIERLYKSDSDDVAFNRQNQWIVNGYYYYTLTPKDNDNRYVARFNLETGKAEYCPDIVCEATMGVNPHFWDYLRQK